MKLFQSILNNWRWFTMIDIETLLGGLIVGALSLLGIYVISGLLILGGIV